MKVVLYGQFWNPFWAIPPSSVETLQSEFSDVEFVYAENDQQWKEQIRDADVYFGYRLDLDVLSSARNLKWFHIPAANVYGLKLHELRERNVMLTNARGLHATPIAEHVIGAMIVFARKYMECFHFQRERHYAQKAILNDPPPIGVLRDKTIFILGLGAIGTQIARLAHAFKMRVVATKRRFAKEFPYVDRLIEYQAFREALPEADYLVICLPLTPATENLIGERELLLLKRAAVIINIARAKIVNRQALLTVLRDQRIRGAALDVFEEEPLPSDSELFSLQNVFLTPHVSGVIGPEHWSNMINLFAENLRRFQLGASLLNVVDLEAGY